VYSLYEDNNTIFNLIVLLDWIALDTIPIVAMLVIHYKNFSSFQNSPDDIISRCSYIQDNLMLLDLEQEIRFEESESDSEIESSEIIKLEKPLLS